MGARALRHAITVAQTRPRTVADLEKGGDGRRQRACVGAVPLHRPAEPGQALLHRGLTALVLLLEAVHRTLHPARGHLHVGPPGRGVVQTPLEGGLQTPQGLGPGPLGSTRSRRSALVLRCGGRMSPEAAPGGRPSSGRARRTALQGPRLISAAGAGRPASWRAIGRRPRTRFCRVCLAWRSASSRGLAASRRSGT
jgi:hypothetical protein